MERDARMVDFWRVKRGGIGGRISCLRDDFGFGFGLRVDFWWDGGGSIGMGMACGGEKDERWVEGGCCGSCGC